jgi:hypothetical protein
MPFTRSAMTCPCARADMRLFMRASGGTSIASLTPSMPEKFMRQFGGKKFDPRQRGKGSNWARWKK